MSFTVHEIVVPVMIHGLNVMDDYLNHAQNWEKKNSLDEGMVLKARLAADMIPFGEQFSVTCDKVETHIAKLRQDKLPKLLPPDMTYRGLKYRLMSVRSTLEKIEPAELADAQAHTYALKPPIVRGWFGGDDYIRHLILPDFFFHIATAHAILRHLGAPVGKRDFLGNLTQQSGGDYS